MSRSARILPSGSSKRFCRIDCDRAQVADTFIDVIAYLLPGFIASIEENITKALTIANFDI